MRNLRGWLETRLAQITFRYLKPNWAILWFKAVQDTLMQSNMFLASPTPTRGVAETHLSSTKHINWTEHRSKPINWTEHRHTTKHTLYVYIYIYVYMYAYIYIYIYNGKGVAEVHQHLLAAQRLRRGRAVARLVPPESRRCESKVGVNMVIT